MFVFNKLYEGILMSCDAGLNHRNFYKSEVTIKVKEEVKAEKVEEKVEEKKVVIESPLKKRFTRKRK